MNGATFAVLTMTLVVGLFAVAVIARVHDWSPFGIAVAGAIAGAAYVAVGVGVYLQGDER